MAEPETPKPEVAEVETLPVPMRDIPVPERPKLTLAIHQLIRVAQNTNGVKQGSYQNYRLYCSKRLRRIRRAVRFLHGHGKKGKYIARKLSPEVSVDSRYLELLVIYTERAWSYALELKDLSENPAHFRSGHHSTKKLRKARLWADQLLEICEAVADERTILEATAYNAYITSYLYVHEKLAKEAIQPLFKAKAIYEQLSKIDQTDHQELCRQRVEELQAKIELCMFTLKSLGVDITALGDDPSFAVLKGKLDAVLDESRKKQSEGAQEVVWKNERISIKDENIKAAYLKTKDLVNALEGAEPKDALAVYEKLFGAYADCAVLVKEAMGHGGKSQKSEMQKSQLESLYHYINYCRLTQSMERSNMLLAPLEKKMTSLGFNLTTKTVGTTSEEIVRQCTTILGLLGELNNVVEDNSPEAVQCQARLLYYQAMSTYYLAVSYLLNNKWAETVVLLKKAQVEVGQATVQAKTVQDLQGRLSQLVKDIKGLGAFVKAKATHSEIVASKQPTTQEPTPQEGRNLLNSLTSWDISYVEEKQLIEMPPSYIPATSKPILFDLANASFEPPNLAEKKKAPRSGGILGFFGY